MLLGHAVLGLQAAPNGHPRADDDPVPDAEVLHLGADLRDLAAHLVPNGLAQQIGQRGAARGAQVRVLVQGDQISGRISAPVAQGSSGTGQSSRTAMAFLPVMTAPLR